MHDNDTTPGDSALREDIRRLGRMLGATLRRQEGPELAGLVEEVRVLARQVREGADGEVAARLDEVLDRMDVDTAIRVVRAFTTFFHLANVAEQVHRLDANVSRAGRTSGWLEDTVDRVLEADLPADVVADVVSRLEMKPVLTAHPTEAARRSILTKLASVASLLEQRGDTRATESEIQTIDRRIAENIENIWQTDELRRVPPHPGRRGPHHRLLPGDARLRRGVRHTGGRLTMQAERLGITLPVDHAPLRFGSWAGGDRDGNPNVTPDVTLATLAMQHDHGLRILRRSHRAALLRVVAIRAGGRDQPRDGSLTGERTAMRCPRCSPASA